MNYDGSKIILQIQNFKTVIFLLLHFQSKATTIKDALKRWEEKQGKSAAKAVEIRLCFQWPPIEKMDNSLAVLANCE
jgi:dynein light chain 1